MKIYHKTGMRIVGVGFCGPNDPVDMPPDEARKMAEKDEWSLTPFVSETKTKTKAVNDGE